MAFPHIIGLDLMGHFAVDKREGKGKEGRGKGMGVKGGRKTPGNKFLVTALSLSA